MNMKTKWNINLLVTLFGIFILIGCNKKSSSNRDSGFAGKENPNGTEKTPEGEKPSTSDKPDSQISDNKPAEVDKDKLSELETASSPIIKNLSFAASTAISDGRFKTEYLLVIRANSDSCVRLKARPSSSSDDQLGDDSLFSDSGKGPCEEETPAADTEVSNDSQGASLTDLEYGSTSNGLALAAIAQKLCDSRIFRMPNRKGSVSTKTGKLAAISPNKKVKVWLDDEVGNICAGGTTPADLNAVAFGPISSIYDPALHKDKVTIKHLQNIASEAEKALQTLTDNFGDVSDVDGNDSVEIFISPDVNRKDFVNFETTAVDQFRSELIYKPQDLAKYDSSKNASSNEGEIVYLWAPDPAGMYAKNLYPTANSLTSNYAKGYIGSQIMTLIINNTRLIVKKSKAEERWLAESLALLAADYVGGNDYSAASKGLYLMSRPQELSLTDGVDKRVSDDLKIYANDSLHGLRNIFGWYLHTKLCDGSSIDPCAKLKNIIGSSDTGVTNIEKILDKKFGKILEDFGASVGVSLSDNPTLAKKNADASKTGPEIVILPELAEISKSSPPQTVENSNDASAISTGNDRALAGPFPSKDQLLFQPILPDNEMDLILAKNSVTYVLLSHLISENTDVATYLGPNLNIAIIPLGDRDDSLRKIHEEKISEAAFMDLRSINLTNSQDSNKTYYNSPVYSSDYSVNYKREIWALGNISNYPVLKEGTDTETPDADSINIKVKPCEGAPDVAACEATGFRDVIVQVTPRDNSKLVPMFFITAPSLNLFRGKLLAGLKSEYITDDIEPVPPSGYQYIEAICESAALYDVTENSNDCAAGGILPADYTSNVCSVYSSEGACVGSSAQSASYEYFTYTQYTNSSGPTFDNYLHSGPEGYPFYNFGRITYAAEPERSDLREFNAEEYNRQFFNFNYTLGTIKNIITFRPIYAGKDGIGLGFVEPSNDETLVTMSDEDAAIYSKIKTVTVNGSGPFLEDDEFVKDCAQIGIEAAVCMLGGTTGQLKSDAIALIAQNNLRIICKGAVCQGRGLNTVGDIWIPEDRIITLEASQAGNSMTTYYKPAINNKELGFCAGKDVAGAKACKINEAYLAGREDIRTQFNLPVSKFTVGCLNSKFVTDFLACGDRQSFKLETRPDDDVVFTYVSEKTGIERNRARPFYMGYQKGEVVAVDKRTHAIVFQVPAAGETILHVLLGGTSSSEGDYILRARVKDFQ